MKISLEIPCPNCGKGGFKYTEGCYNCQFSASTSFRVWLSELEIYFEAIMIEPNDGITIVTEKIIGQEPV